MGIDNPYATALDGLVLDDPVQAFFDFCREREAIRLRRERGAPPPWSEDPIFQQARFLNIFREDDRGSRALFRFLDPVPSELPDLVQAVFFARWCNRQSTLDALSLDQLQTPDALVQVLEGLPEQPWCNVAAYPVEPVQWEGVTYSRLDSATRLFSQIKGDLTEMILNAKGDVVAATEAINGRFNMSNDFPVFMAVMDLAWFRPDVISPASHVPTGIGAVAYLDRLQQHLGLEDHAQTCERMIALQAEYWPEARRSFQPIDIEYLSCECRKYYSYVNGTKRFEGKNVFRPGESATLEFDVPAPAGAPFETQIHVIAGGPCSGKTTILRALSERGHRVEVETSERMLEEGIARGETSSSLRMDPVDWQQRVLEEDYALFEGLPADQLMFTDTSFIEDIVFGSRAGISMGPGVTSWLHTKRYKQVFFLAPLENYETTAVRMESQSLAAQISDEVRACYQAYGYAPIVVPPGSVAERVDFILSHSR